MSGNRAASVWMGDIDQYMDERVIAEAFSMMGEHVISVKLMKDHKTGLNKNFCFVELTSREAVDLAVKRLNHLPLPNYPAKRFKLNYSLRDQQPSSDGASGSIDNNAFGNEFSIYVGGLNFNTTDEELKTLFAHYSSLKEAKVVKDEHQRSKGFGFVRFFTEKDREAAISQMDGAVGPMGVTLKVNKAQSKGSRFQSTPDQGLPYSSGQGITQANIMGGYQQQPYGYGHNAYATPLPLHQQAQMQMQPQQMQVPVQAAPQPVAAPKAQQQAPRPQPTKQQEDDDEALEDHSAPVNMVATNLAFIQANQDFYKKLADSRWHPVTSYSTTMAEICQ